MAENTSLIFKVRRKNPELIIPAKPTPKECKLLSDIDDQHGLRFQLTTACIYHANKRMDGIDPVQVIRDALAKALVFYYPLAGRLREGDGQKLMVDCNSEGVLFVEGDADVTLEQLFGEYILPPIPGIDELLYNVPGSQGVLDTTIYHFQVTRFTCGGFILAMNINHTISDAVGIFQFLIAIGEIARGAASPSIQPVWQRELLSARNPPRITCTHHAYDEIPADINESMVIPSNDIVCHDFFFGPNEISTLRKFIPSHLGQRISTFEVLLAFMWRCRTIALQIDPHENIRVLSTVDARAKFNPPLPSGYYGNALAFASALTTAERLCINPLGYAIELVTKIKSCVTEEYMRSLADLMVIKGRPLFNLVNSFIVSDVTRVPLEKSDFGWGTPAYAGTVQSDSMFAGFASFYHSARNSKGEKGILFPIGLPTLAMERLKNEINGVLKGNKFQEDFVRKKPSIARSPL